jgi:hypothetical protein
MLYWWMHCTQGSESTKMTEAKHVGIFHGNKEEKITSPTPPIPT